jgi:hypothetical protein
VRIPHLLSLAAIATDRKAFTPATDDHRGWSAITPYRIAALSGRPLAALAAALPAVADFCQPAAAGTLASAKPMRACRRCAAAKAITAMVIIRARPHDYLCTRHQLWHHGIHDIDLTTLPVIAASQRSHNQRVKGRNPADIARAHRQAHDIIEAWLTGRWHPTLTRRWQERMRLLDTSQVSPSGELLDVATHPEMLAVARLVLTGPDRRALSLRAGTLLRFRYPAHPRDPLFGHLSP